MREGGQQLKVAPDCTGAMRAHGTGTSLEQFWCRCLSTSQMLCGRTALVMAPRWRCESPMPVTLRGGMRAHGTRECFWLSIAREHQAPPHKRMTPVKLTAQLVVSVTTPLGGVQAPVMLWDPTTMVHMGGL